MSEREHKQIYFALTITASDEQTEIWLGADDGHFVQKDKGQLCTSLLPGTYFVEFGLGTACYPINLSSDLTYNEVEIRSGPSCLRPTVQIYD